MDLRWHTPAEFKALSHEQRDDLVSWQKTPEGKATLAKSRESAGFGKKRSKGGNGGSNGKRKHDGNQNPSKQQKWLRKQYVKKPEGIMKHIMRSLLASRAEGEKETTSALIISTLSSVAITPAAPVPPPASGKAPAISSVNAKLNGSATVMTLNSIMRKGGE